MRQRFGQSDDYVNRLEDTVMYPITHTGKAFYYWSFFLLAISAWGLFAYSMQLRYGLVSTGMNDVVMYGMYIVNFVFFIGISYAGALVSAILRLTNAGWRNPVTRMAELIAVGGLTDGALQPIIDLGRPDRLSHIILFGRFQSPLLWDIIAIITYLGGSFIYLYLPLIPDFAMARDRLGAASTSLKARFYRLFAAGWKDTPEQRKKLNKGIAIMAITIIPLAVSVHTVVAFIFSVTLRPGWNSTIYGIYFVVAAVFSGTAALLVIIWAFRKFYHLEEYIQPKHFRYLAYIMLIMLFFYFYLMFTEYVTTGYKLAGEEKTLLTLVLTGSNAWLFWLYVFGALIIPAYLVITSKKHTIGKIVLASVLVFFGLWLKRYIIIIPTLETPLMPFDIGAYNPTWVEWSISAATLAFFIFMMTLGAKILPLISVWEMKEHHEEEQGKAAAGQPALTPAPDGMRRKIL
jgi:Ni/Fe-hydrogenase subunit HybB-like protein